MFNTDVFQTFSHGQLLLLQLSVFLSITIFLLMLAVDRVKNTPFGRRLRVIERNSPIKIKNVRDISLGLIALAFGFASQPLFVKLFSFITATLVFGIFLAQFVQRSISRPKLLWIFPVPFFGMASLGFYFGRYEYPNAGIKILLIALGVTFCFLGLFVTVMLVSGFFAKRKNPEEGDSKQ